MKKFFVYLFAVTVFYFVGVFQISESVASTEKSVKKESSTECPYLQHHSEIKSEKECPYLKNKEQASKSCPYSNNKEMKKGVCPYSGKSLDKQETNKEKAPKKIEYRYIKNT